MEIIVEDLTHLCICPVCGAPDCGAEYALWTELEGQKEYVSLAAAASKLPQLLVL
jgi:hypothetical protein